MRFTSAFVAGALAVAARAQDTTTEAPSTTTWSLDPAQSSVLACYDSCDATDVNCLADCNPVPRPNESQAIDTTNCVAACDQGEGTEEDIAAYIDCTTKCIGDLFFQDGEGTPNNSSSDDDSTTAPSTETSSGADSTETDSDGNTTASDEPTESGDNQPTQSNGDDGATETDSNDATETTDDEGAATALIGSVLAGGLALILAL